MVVVRLAAFAYSNLLIAWKVLVVPGRVVVRDCYDDEWWNSPASSVDSLDNRSPLAIT
jgi:hypothetical protein